MTFKIIKLSDPDWDAYVKAAHIYDFHHTSAYHEIEAKTGDEALLCVAESLTDGFIALPLIQKQIPNTTYFDLTSVYGYGGPITSVKLEDLDQKLLHFFKKEFLNYCEENKVVSVFSRLHPLIEQSKILSDFGKIQLLNKVVVMDLSEPIDIQRQKYSKSNKNQINQLKKKKGYTVRNIEVNDNENIHKFQEIYNETMDRVDATSFYYFDFDYFKQLLNNDSFDSHLLAVFKEDQMCAAGIFTESNTIMQYHLSGTKDEFIRDKPMKLLLDEARLLANERGLSFFNLGGGVAGSDEDTLFLFKASFSKNFKQFSVWNLICNSGVYKRLVDEKGIQEKDHPNFFPLYRVG